MDLQRPHTARVEAFSDGVFAIIITLLVLEIKVPYLHNGLSSPEAWAALKVLSPKFLSFILSFLYIAIFWVNHHHFFMIIAHMNRGLMWLNNFVLLFLSFVPFPTAFIGDYPHNSVALALFGAVLLVAASLFTIMWHYAVDKKLVHKNVPSDMLELGKKRGLLGPICFGMSIVLAFVAPVLAWILFILVPVYYFLPLKWYQKGDSS